MFDLKACRPIAASSGLPFGHVTDRSGWLLLRWRLSSCEMIIFLFFSRFIHTCGSVELRRVGGAETLGPRWAWYDEGRVGFGGGG